MAGPKKTATLERKPTSVSKKFEDITKASEHPANVEAGRKTRYGFELAFLFL